MTECELLQRYEAGERDFPDANLRGANLRYTDLSGANLRYTDLSGANLRGANLRGANLTGANLRGADLQYAKLHRTTLCGATIDGAILNPEDIGGPGHILCALTDAEWAWVRAQREEAQDD